MIKISKTYIPKDKEKYMCAKHIAFFKKKLEQRFGLKDNMTNPVIQKFDKKPQKKKYSLVDVY